MTSSFDPNEEIYRVGNLLGTEVYVRETRTVYETKSPRHAKVHEKTITNLEKLSKGAVITLTYMLLNINRKNYTTWANLGIYFNDGYLCFAKHQKYMALERKVNQGTISRHLTELQDAFYIRELNREYIDKKGTSVPIVVYCLGEFDIKNDEKTEVHYCELDNEILKKLNSSRESLFPHNIRYTKIHLISEAK